MTVARVFLVVRMLLVSLAALAVATVAQAAGKVAALAINPPVAGTASPASPTTGTIEIIVRLADKPLVAVVGNNAHRTGLSMTRAQQQAYVAQLNAKQSALMTSIAAMGGKEITRLAKATNVLIVSIDAKRVAEVSRLAGVAQVRRVTDYELDLSETVPYIGGKALQLLGVDGTGVKVAVLDSGIDYTHRNLYGPGTVAAYAAAYGPNPASPLNTTRDGLFPTAKVYEGYDFVGEVWPNGPLAPDPDPIDYDGHGTHVADIIAGKSQDGTHVGVAPEAKLLAVKVCSAVSTSCSGIALLEGVDYALDPNGDGDLSDAVDVMNLSLGQSYGQREDDLTYALGNASRFGVVVVAAAGNSGDRPFIASSPANAPELISVAQTQVPSAQGIPLVINSPGKIAGTYGNTATVDWAPVGAGVTGNVAYVGRACPSDPLLANPTGKIALVIRGACSVSLKVDSAVAAGAIGVLVGLSASGDPFSFSYGGGSNFAPTLVIEKSLSDSIRANLPVNATISPANAISLVGSVVGSSARGPGYSYRSIKPDIGAPGASVSADVGTGTGESAFGGTSGATPMIAGSAALLLQAFPTESPLEIKARLMNAAETTIYTNPLTRPGELAPISRIGAGEVRVNKSFALQAAAWDATDSASVSLSFGYTASTGTQVLRKKVTVRNYANTARTFAITSGFRYANDAASGAVTIGAPASVTVPANSTASFTLALTVDAGKLPLWTFNNAGADGGSGPLLQAVEFDGYVTLTQGADTLKLPWHLLPHKAANTKAASTNVALNGAPSGSVNVGNTGGAIDGNVDVFALTGTSPQGAFYPYPNTGDNYALIDLKSAGVRYFPDDDIIQFAVNTWGNRSHPAYPAEFDIYIDSNNDGVPDYVIYNGEAPGGFAATGQTLVYVRNLSTNKTTAYYYADADLVSGNMILTAPASAVGIVSPATKFSFSVYAFDNYFSGVLMDAIENMVFTGGTPRFSTPDVFPTVPAGGTITLPIQSNPAGATASPSQTGLLLMYRNGKPGLEADAVTITP
jgi:subtilisin family serine protease